jgi:DMSO/TMAO reductase YedYZ molybdopterin-dependent catalytic subunit
MSDESPLPPGQQWVAPGKWPVIGERAPRQDDAPWMVSVTGLVERARDFSLNDLRSLPYNQLQLDIHCVTRWSKPGAQFGGVFLADVLKLAGVAPSARYVSFVARSDRSHSTSLLLADALELGVLIALDHDDQPLASEHGGPVRVVTPGRYFYKSLKWLERIELLAEDRLGYWEQVAGYHNQADPWRQERYLAANLDKRQVERLLALRDFSGQDLRSVDARGHDLTGLMARGALLRDADFGGCWLTGACFDGANLSNAHFAGADVRSASFRQADVEGADFSGADLRGADLSGAAMTGVTFFTAEGSGSAAARIDATTRIEPSAIADLTPPQANFVTHSLKTPDA